MENEKLKTSEMEMSLETMYVQYIWAVAISAASNRSGSRIAGRTKQFECFLFGGPLYVVTQLHVFCWMSLMP